MARVANISDTVPEPCRVAGTWLKPFCLGHHLLFTRLGFPFADKPMAAASIPDHILPAILICAGHSYEWTLAGMLDGQWVDLVANWTRAAGGGFLRRRAVNWAESEENFRAYLADGYARPPLYRHISRGDGNSIDLTAPWEEVLKCRLVGGGFTETEVLNGYLPGRWYDYHTLAEFRQLETLERMGIAGMKNPAKSWRPAFYTTETHAKIHPKEKA